MTNREQIALELAEIAGALDVTQPRLREMGGLDAPLREIRDLKIALQRALFLMARAMAKEP